MPPTTIPTSVEQLDPLWLTEALRAGGVLNDASVATAGVVPVGQGAGVLCQLARITLTYDHPAAGAPATLIAKFPTTVPETRQMVGLFRFYEREVRFYQEIAADIAISTARCYYSTFDAGTGDFIVLLEDLGARRIGDQLQSCSVEDAMLAVTEMAKLHAAWWQHPRLDSFTWMPRINDISNKMGLSLYPQAWVPFVERFGHKLSAEVRATGERLGAQVNDILDRLVDGPHTLCHGDFRLDNLFFRSQPSHPALSVIDWQIASRATGTYDLGYFTSQSLSTDIRRTHEMDLLRMYHELLREGGVKDYSFDQCQTDYRWTLLFCLAYPVMAGGMGDLANERGYALANAMMERSAAAIEDWKAGELLN